MNIDRLQLVNFRSHTKSDFEFGKRTLIVGVNGAGKSNVLEAVYMVATGKSFRADVEYELLCFGQNVSNVICYVGGIEDDFVVQMVLTDGSVGAGRKKFIVNGVGRRQVDAVGKLRAVLFSPADIELVTGSPSGRRKYLDFVIGQVDREYRRSLLAYEKALRQRNRLLDLIRDGMANRTQLFFWDKTLIKNGEYVQQKRTDYIDVTNATNKVCRMIYDRSLISDERLKQYEVQELSAGSTLVGPHRDDFSIEQDGKDVSKYGSRGEQRMAVWWLKQCEIKYLEQESGRVEEVINDFPVLLLDDIFSELDLHHRNEVIDFVKSYGGQVIMTTAEEEGRNLFEFDKVIKL